MPNRWFTSPAFVVSHRRAAHVHRSFNTLGIPEVTMKENPLDPRFCPKVVDIIPPGALASIGILTAVPVVDVYRPADQRKWCKAVLDWMDDEVAPANGCPTDDLLADGACRRSPTCGKCLLLLPFTHPEWEPALVGEGQLPGAFSGTCCFYRRCQGGGRRARHGRGAATGQRRLPPAARRRDETRPDPSAAP